MSSYTHRTKSRETSRIFDKAIGDVIVRDRIKKLEDEKKAQKQADPDYKISELRRNLIVGLSDSNKHEPENFVENMNTFVGNVEMFLQKEFKIKSEHDKKLQVLINKVDETLDGEKQKKIKAKNLLKFQPQMKLGTPKKLDEFVYQYSTHVGNMVKFDEKTNYEYKISEKFLDFVNENMQVLYSRFANLVIKVQKIEQSKNELGV